MVFYSWLSDDMGVNDLLASWRVTEKVALVAGLRHIFARMDLRFMTTVGGSKVLDEKFSLADDDQFDFLAGVHYEHRWNERWSMEFSAESAIAGENDRDYSAELRGVYRVNHRNNLWMGYRYLNIGSDAISDGKKTRMDMLQQGPTIGWAFVF